MRALNFIEKVRNITQNIMKLKRDPLATIKLTPVLKFSGTMFGAQI